LLRLLLDSFSAICFVLMTVLCLRERRRRSTRWGSSVHAWTAAVCAVHFLYRATRFLFPLRIAGAFALLDLWAQSFLPALLFHLIYASERAGLPRRVIWKICLGAFYGFAAAGGAYAAAGLLRGIGQPPDLWRRLSLSPLAAAAVLDCVMVVCSRRAAASGLERRQRRWILALCGLLAAVTLLWMAAQPPWLPLLLDAIPLGFVFVVTYSVERFTFFDVLIKKGALAFCALFALTLYFVFITPWLMRLHVGFAFPLTVWPIVLAYPWFNRRMCAWLDRVCLGRCYSPAAAAEHFLSGLQGALSEDELARRAERLLAGIFQAQAEVSLGAGPGATGELGGEAICVPVRSHGKSAGEFRLRSREPRTRFLSEDMALAASLAGTFAFLLENLCLRDKRQEQERRVHELQLNANSLELKALRAQVNPHFLFNALNTIAGLIPRYPGRAERTIEQLAEVFRFTLRRMDREWVRVEEEIEAVRAYLDVEQARFGDHLSFRIEMSEEAGHARIPAMIVQTLVENAVKHGIGVQSAPGAIEVAIAQREERVLIEVRDSGPGFAAGSAGADGAGGHGLRNIRERLRGYFGDGAELRTGRDEAREMTLVSVDMPRSAAGLDGVLR
jgi:signal transduction histidine kinase